MNISSRNHISITVLLLDHSSKNTLTGLDVENTGKEAVHLREDSSNNLLTHSTIHDAGRDTTGNGEGVYVGSSWKHWDLTGGRPDHSDNNRIVGNHIYNTASECVDVKEGTTGTVLASNDFNGSGIQGENGANTLVSLKGNDATLLGNAYDKQGNGRVEHDVKIQTFDQAPGWRATTGSTIRATCGSSHALLVLVNTLGECGEYWMVDPTDGSRMRLTRDVGGGRCTPRTTTAASTAISAVSGKFIPTPKRYRKTRPACSKAAPRPPNAGTLATLPHLSRDTPNPPTACGRYLSVYNARDCNPSILQGRYFVEHQQSFREESA